ncbi:MAG: PTS sugar transporter subunit IIC [Candidatus Hydrogenedentota bacterium]|nr:MAG: PTS sugar transporter subunit IIC [Candidatus Hydrogenedentota bacterium]
MLLGEILHRAVIKTDLEASTKDAAIAELVDSLIEAKDLTPNLRKPVLHALNARERSMSTGMEMGIALPHGTSPDITNLVGALGISTAGIEWQCLDDQPANLIMLLVLPRHEFQVHVRTLAGISHLLNEETFRTALINAPDADTILKLIRKEETGSIFDGFRKRFK